MTRRLPPALALLMMVAACSDGDETPSSRNKGNSKTGCGNNRIDEAEICDGTALAGKSCETLVGTAGELACLVDCKAYDVSQCAAPASCGNGTLDVGELCDGDELGSATCTALGFAGGTLACASNCLSRDTTGCQTVTCTPDCTGRVCGPDPVCGVSCGSCATGTCSADGLCGDTCSPDCTGRVCGPDPNCGISCGTCASGTCTSAGSCSADCTPDCSSRDCGPDPICGESCGTCDTGSCTIFGTCTQDCVPDCSGRTCGPDPTCAVSCGECGDGSYCNIFTGTCGSTCTPNCSGRECGRDPVCNTSCGTCETGICNSAGSCVDNSLPNIVVTLLWDTMATDLDLHLRRQADALCSATDCYYAHLNPNWDLLAGSSVGDPLHAGDDSNGLGPEIVTLQTAGANNYVVSVHYVGGTPVALPTVATVEITLQGVATTFSKPMAEKERWDVARIAWTNGAGTVIPIDSIQTGWTCENNNSTPCTTDADCPDLPWPETQYCNATLGIAGTCANGCRTSDDCPTDLSCNGAHGCVAAVGLAGWQEPCAQSADCQTGLYCNPFYSVCSESCTPPAHTCTEHVTCCPISQATYCQDLLGLGVWAYCTDTL